jgi:hypothetical protein
LIDHFVARSIPAIDILHVAATKPVNSCSLQEQHRRYNPPVPQRMMMTAKATSALAFMVSSSMLEACEGL